LEYTEEENEFLERRSKENLIETYRRELLQIVKGEDSCKQLPRAVRRRFRGYGILLKVGVIYKVTSQGRKMLGLAGDAEG